MYDCRYWLWLSLKFEPGAVKCDALLHAFGNNPKAIYEAERGAYEDICKGNLRLLNALCDKSLDRVYEVLDFCEKNNVGILTRDDEKYPSSLLRIQGQPPVIYYKGTIPNFSKQLSIAIVGTRNVTAYGSSAAYTIAHDIATADAIVVSGMALGTDTAAHRGALDAKGTTVAFLGCGIDRVYPKENEQLMNEIIANGAVMTDYPPESRPEGRHFPIRNRLISGVSHGVLVVEAAKRSGALITADHALKQGKLLYAIPGRIGELASEGTNHLLIAGAKTVTGAGDLLADFRSLFNISEIKNKSGYTQYRSNSANDFSEPYKTPTFNPYASKTDKANMSNNFRPCPPEPKKTEPTPPPEPISFNTTAPKRPNPIYADLGKVPIRGNNTSEFSKPKPIIVFSEFDDEKHTKAYISLSEDEKAELENIDMLAHRPILKYRDDPVPLGGYRVELTEEKKQHFERLDAEMDARNQQAGMYSMMKPKPMFDCVTDFHELKMLNERDKEIHAERERIRAEARAKGVTDYSGLTNVEIMVLKELEGGKRLTLDTLSQIGIPLTNLLSVLTVLEIKHRIVQLPGGYYEINKDY